MSPWKQEALAWVDDDNVFLEDLLLRWVWKNPRRAAVALVAVVCGIPLLIGFGLGAWIC